LSSLLSCFSHFFGREVPTIFSLSANALKKAPFPSSVSQLESLSTEQWLYLSPVLTCLLVCCSLPFLLLWQFHTRKVSCTEKAKNLIKIANENTRRREIAREERVERKEERKERYWMTRVLLIRGIAFIYFFAFLTSAFQSRALFGSSGLLPVSYFSSNRPKPAFFLLEYLGVGYGDWQLELISWVGVFLSLVMMTSQITSFVLPLLLWLMYLSIVNLGSMVINYGWEWLTLEAGFLVIFLCPIFSRSPFPHNSPPSRLVIWLFRWLAFRLLIGAGMSKLGTASSACWKELTCTTTHYFTQPMPNFFSWFAHHLPVSFHRTEVALTFFEQLILPFFVLVPIRPVRIVTGLLELFFQVCIVGTGNYAWINFIGALPCLALFDDQFLSHFFSREATQAADIQEEKSRKVTKVKYKKVIRKAYRLTRTLICVGLVVFITYKSTEPIKELYTDRPWLHFYDDYFFVNSQGVFGFINQKRVVLVLSYTHQTIPSDPTKSSCKDSSDTGISSGGRTLSCSELAPFCSDFTHGSAIRRQCPKSCGVCRQPIPANVTWLPLQFKNLPGPVDTAPWFNSPYHYRFDWEVWIQTTARMENQGGQSMTVPGVIQTLIAKIMAGDTDAIGLVGTPPQLLLDHQGVPPTAIRADFYSYQFSEWSELLQGIWWKREPIPGSSPFLFTPDPSQKHSRHQQPQTRKSAPQRHWILLMSVVGTFLAVSGCLEMALGRIYSQKKVVTQRNSHHSPGWWFRPFFFLSLPFFLFCFYIALFSDYPPFLPSFNLSLLSTLASAFVVISGTPLFMGCLFYSEFCSVREVLNNFYALPSFVVAICIYLLAQKAVFFCASNNFPCE